jgi:hypothetical protein
MAKGITSYSFEELHEEIAKDAVWKLELGYLPKANAAGLKLYQIRRNQHLAGREQQLEKKLLVGNYQDQKKSPVYVHVYRSPSGHWTLVDIHIEDEAETERIRLMDNCPAKSFEPLKNINFVEPFKQLGKVGGGAWRNEFRCLTLFYFLEQGLLERMGLTAAGLESFRKACSIISAPVIRTSGKPTRSWPNFNKTTAPQKQSKLQTSNSIRPQEVEKKAVIKEEPSPVAIPVTAPENDSARAVTTVRHQDGSIAARLLPKTSDHTKKSPRLLSSALSKTGLPTHIPAAKALPASELKRKRSMEDEPSEGEGGENTVSHGVGDL